MKIIMELKHGKIPIIRRLTEAYITRYGGKEEKNNKRHKVPWKKLINQVLDEPKTFI